MTKCCHNNGYFCPMCDDWVDPSQVLPSLKEKIEAMKKESLWQWMDDDGNIGLVDKMMDSPDISDGCTVDFTWNKCLDDVLSLISKMQEEEK